MSTASRPDVPAHRDTGIDVRPDPSRVVTRLFVPGREDVGPGDSRAVPVIQRLLALSDAAVEHALADVRERFGHRHRDFDAVLADHASMVMSRVEGGVVLSPDRRLLIGASFTHEYSVEGAALCNPSAVLAPGTDAGGDPQSAEFIMSVRGIGEGHRSSIGFRTGRVTNGQVAIDDPVPYARTGTVLPGVHHRSVFHAKLSQLDDDRENAAFVLDALPATFTDRDLHARIDGLAADRATRRLASTTITNLRSIARSSYSVEFPTDTDVSERILWPHAPAEQHGMEDARFVRFVDDDGSVTYYGTYTAFDGSLIAQHLLETVDFRSFDASPMAGIAAVGKGLALFPRKIAGRYVALSRHDREANSIAFSDDIRCWSDPVPIQTPTAGWEILQLGNCGSPIETAAGWLVLTHGVGPMRTYTLGAILLDLDDPRRVIARSGPLVSPGNDRRRDGYVPNVAYSCGGFAHGDTLVLPYGIGDQTIAVTTFSIERLVADMVRAD